MVLRLMLRIDFILSDKKQPGGEQILHVSKFQKIILAKRQENEGGKVYEFFFSLNHSRTLVSEGTKLFFQWV